MDTVIEKLSNMNIMAYETSARGIFYNGTSNANSPMYKSKVTLGDLLGTSSPLTDYLKVEYNQMKQQIGDVSFEDYKNMAFADTSFDYYSKSEKITELAVSIVVNGAILAVGAMLPLPIMIALGFVSGGKNIIEWKTGTDLITGEKLSAGDRIIRGLSGIADLALAGYGTYKMISTPKGNISAITAEKASGANDFKFGSNSKNHLKNVETVNTKRVLLVVIIWMNSIMH